MAPAPTITMTMTAVSLTLPLMLLSCDGFKARTGFEYEKGLDFDHRKDSKRWRLEETTVLMKTNDELRTEKRYRRQHTSERKSSLESIVLMYSETGTIPKIGCLTTRPTKQQVFARRQGKVRG